MNPTNLPFEFPFQWDNESLREGAGVTPEGAAILKQRDRDLEDFLATLGGGGGPPAFFVAASDASALSRAVAHYTCDGTNDEVEINEALAAAYALASAGGYPSTDANAPGARVLLSEGTFHTGDTIQHGTSDLNSAPNMTLQGAGMTATRIKQASLYYRFGIYAYSPGFHIADFTLDASATTDGGYGIRLAGQSSSATRVRLRATGSNAGGSLYFDAAYGSVMDSEFRDIPWIAGVKTVGDRCRFIGCTFVNTGGEAVAAASGQYSIVMGNNVQNSNTDSGGTDSITVGANSVVVGNICDDFVAIPATISSGAGSQVANNVLL